jgi:hypothetical protein
MRQNHPAGERLFVDYAGQSLLGASVSKTRTGSACGGIVHSERSSGAVTRCALGRPHPPPQSESTQGPLLRPYSALKRLGLLGRLAKDRFGAQATPETCLCSQPGRSPRRSLAGPRIAVLCGNRRLRPEHAQVRISDPGNRIKRSHHAAQPGNAGILRRTGQPHATPLHTPPAKRVSPITIISRSSYMPTHPEALGLLPVRRDHRRYYSGCSRRRRRDAGRLTA